MDFYEDLPDGLQPLFPVGEFRLPEAIRTLLSDGWNVMKPNDQTVFKNNIHDKKGLSRVIYASGEAVKALMKNPPKDIIRI